MFGAGIDFEFLNHLVAKSAVREHTPDSSGQRGGRVLRHEVGEIDPAFAGDVTGVVEVFLVQVLVARFLLPETATLAALMTTT